MKRTLGNCFCATVRHQLVLAMCATAVAACGSETPEERVVETLQTTSSEVTNRVALSALQRQLFRDLRRDGPTAHGITVTYAVVRRPMQFIPGRNLFAEGNNLASILAALSDTALADLRVYFRTDSTAAVFVHSKDSVSVRTDWKLTSGNWVPFYVHISMPPPPALGRDRPY